MNDYLKKRQQLILDGRPLPEKKKYTIPKKSEKRKQKEAEEKELRGGDETYLVKWFRGRMKLMTGHCMWCGAKTETNVYRGAIFSICHILEKRDTMCPSVKTHPSNWIELCPDHHTMFDKMNWGEREKLGFWPEIVDRLIMIYPDLAQSERRHFPDSVLKIIENNEPF